MKPVVVFVGNGENVEIEKKKLEKLVDDAYNAGYTDGRYSNTTPTWGTYPVTTLGASSTSAK